MAEVVVEVGQLHRPGELSGPTRGMRDPADVFVVGLGRGPGQQPEGELFDRRQAAGAQRFSAYRRELEQFVEPGHRLRVRCDRVGDVLEVFNDQLTKPSALPDMTDARDLLTDSWIHPRLPADGLPDRIVEGGLGHKRVDTIPDGIPACMPQLRVTNGASPD
jgi:hypothetical protein